MAEAHPLEWPSYWPRRPLHKRERARFHTRFTKARDNLIREIKLMGARYPVLSTNIPLRRDNLPYAGQAQPKDSAVAVYFERKGTQFCFACDKWLKVEDNVQAIRKTIEAIRGIERWGTSEMMERAFQAFKALPDLSQPKPWREILGFDAQVSPTQLAIAEQFRHYATKRHPDKPGGSKEAFQELQAARDRALRELDER